ncbi:MAG TPA: diacylglycerol kinase [Geopsychrobacteraceae bacterium]|nr:diacylglycerol kinase [Geopsychrobacteraceae bacterium]
MTWIFKKLYNSTLYSFSGLKTGIAEDQSVRMEAILVLIAVPLALMVEASLSERFWLIFSVLIIFIVELLNTAIEELVDHLFKEIDPIAKKAKDLGSAAVFVGVMHACGVWGTILYKNYL